jgi:hypothetical protein
MLAVVIILALVSAETRAGTVSSNHQLEVSAELHIVNSGGADSNVLESTVGTYSGYYDLGDANGNGIRDDAATTVELDLDTNMLFTDNGEHIKLNMNALDLVGNTSVTNISTHTAGAAGNFIVKNVGTVRIGSIIADGADGNHDHGGEISIGSAASPATGNVEISEIDVNDGNEGGNNTGNITVYGSNNVDLGTVNMRQYKNGNPGILTVHHDGAFTCDVIDGGGSPRQDRSTMVASGDLGEDGVGAGDTFSASELDFSAAHGYVSGEYGGDITISNYYSVTIGTLRFGSDSEGRGGIVNITNIYGDVLVTNSFAASRSGQSNPESTAYLGTLNGGDIRIEDLNVGHFSKCAFDPDGTAYVQNDLSNFDTNNTGGAGTYDSPIVTTQTVLRVASGKLFVYDAALNPELETNAYQVASLDGTAGSGGLLLSEENLPPAGTVFMIQ